MSKYTISFLGRDAPGVVAAITRLFGEMGCNIEAMTQTILSGEFAAIFVVAAPGGLSLEEVKNNFEIGLPGAGVDLSVLARPFAGSQWGESLRCSPFVATVEGPDRPGIIGAICGVFARHGVNIENLTAILGEQKPGRALFAFELLAPDTVDMGRLRRELAHEAQKLDLIASVQHRDIFEAVNRVSAY